VTVVFLGEVPAGDLEGVITAAGAAVAGSRDFSLIFDHASGLHRGPGRIYALRAESPAFEEVAWSLRRGLARWGQAGREDRRPLPHVTVARSRTPLVTPERRLSPPLRLDVRRIVLYESFLGPGGARHVERASFPLGGVL